MRPACPTSARLAVCTSYGGTRLKSMLAGDPPRKSVQRVLRAIVKPGAPIKYLAHYDMNRSTDETRARFKEKVEAAMDRF